MSIWLTEQRAADFENALVVLANDLFEEDKAK
jgi:hypothetical protein